MANKVSPEQRVIVRLWLTLNEVQQTGHTPGRPLPTWRLDEDDDVVFKKALDAYLQALGLAPTRTPPKPEPVR